MDASTGSPQASAAPAQQPYGEVFDRGYQHYTGAREGRSHAIQALVIYSIKRALGIKKSWTSKIIPFVLYLFAYSPAVVVVGVLAFVPAGTTLSYHFLNEFIRLALIVFAAAGAAEMLCDDRRENVLPLYFSRAITRLDYLLSKIVALILLMLTIAFGPPLIMFLGKTLLDNNPVSYFGNHVGDLGRIALFGLLASAYFAAIGLGIAAYTNRKGVAGAVFIGGLLIVSGLTEALYQALGASSRKYLLLVSPSNLITVLSREIFHGTRPQGDSLSAVQLPLGVLIAGVLAVVVITASIMYRRYLADE